jgi:hypothetical protein
LKPVPTLFRRIAPVFGMRPTAALAYYPKLRDAFQIETGDAIDAAFITGGLLCGSVANCVGFAKTLGALRYAPADEGRRREGFEGGDPFEMLAAIFRREPHETLLNKTEFVVLTNPTEIEIRAGAADYRILFARFVSPVERPLCSDLRGAKILGPRGLASIAQAVRGLGYGGSDPSEEFGFESQVLQ